MGYYEDIYVKRVNRFGTDFKSRIQGEREYAFENYLKSSIYGITFSYKGVTHNGTFEPYKQNETETLHYLLAKREVNLDNGTILQIHGNNWMVYWKEENEASGYDRYVMLKMTHQITMNTAAAPILCYMYGVGDARIKDDLKSNKMQVVYNEDNNSNFLIMPANQYIKKDDYFTITTVNHDAAAVDFSHIQGFRVTGFDVISTKGIEYVTVNPMYLKDETPAPQPQPGDDSKDFYWIKMGN